MLFAITVTVLSRKDALTVDTGLFSLYFILISGFLFLNRINYPHYAAWFAPFLVIFLVDSWKSDRRRFIYLVAFQVIYSTGGLIWSIYWILKLYKLPSSYLDFTGFLLFTAGFLLLIMLEVVHLKNYLDLKDKIMPVSEV